MAGTSTRMSARMESARTDGRTARLPLHEESTAVIAAPREAVFGYLDDFHQLSAHMQRPSGMMAGSRMVLATDADGGRVIGSRVRLSGAMLGLRLELEEVVVEREPPRHKAWETVRARLLVIGAYRLAFDLAEVRGGTRVTVRIDYALPDGVARVAGWLLGRTYARWCVVRMIQDATRHFATRPADAGRM